MQQVDDLAWNKLLWMLAWAIVIGTITDGRLQAMGPHKRPHKMIARGFRCAVRA